MSRFHHPAHRLKRNRRGSALLVCTLAITVISIASVAILRSTQRGITRVDAQRSTVQARLVADGLVQRAIAAIRLNPAARGTLPLPKLPLAEPRVELTPLSATATRIEVYLYNNAGVAARDVVVDPVALSS